MKNFDYEEVRRRKAVYTPGKRIRLVKMNDTQAPPIGTEGTVLGVDGIGSILVRWDNGSMLSVAMDEDIVEKV